MRGILGLLVGLLLAASAFAAVQVSERTRINLLRGSSTVATLGSWADCRAEALRRAQAESDAGRTSGTQTYTCQTERRDVIAVFSENPPPVDCVVGEWGPWIPGEWSACVAGEQSREETRQRSVLVDPKNGGAACPTLDESRVVSQACGESPPVGVLLFADSFDYAVDREATAAAKSSAFLAAGYTHVKDEVTEPGRANGYLYTRSSAPGCGAAPSGRMLTVEGRASNGQTDFYLQLGRGTAGDIPARLFVQFDLCVSRSGSEMSDFASAHDKLLYPLFGSRTGYPMATTDTAWLQTTSAYAYRGNQMIPKPEPGSFTFATQAPSSESGPRAVVQDQVAAGSGHWMTPNVGDPWIRPNRWYRVRMLLDVSGEQGVHQISVADPGQLFVLISDFRGGVTPGFTYQTAPLDRIGAKFLRIPTTFGTVSGGGPDRWINLDNLRLATSEGAL